MDADDPPTSIEVVNLTDEGFLPSASSEAGSRPVQPGLLLEPEGDVDWEVSPFFLYNYFERLPDQLTRYQDPGCIFD